MSSENDEQLRLARNSIYGKCGEYSEHEALSIIERLVTLELPSAMLLLGHLYWEGFVVERDDRMAFELISKAVAMDFIPAMTSLGGLYFSGTGCVKDFDKAVHWYEQGEARGDGFYSVHVGAVALGGFEFQRSFGLSVNGVQHPAPRSFLGKLNRWLLDCKRKVVAKQAAVLDRNPNAYAGSPKRYLPFMGSIGGSPALKLAGQRTIEQIGWRNAFLDEAVWFPLAELGFDHGDLPTFSGLMSLGIEQNGFSWTLDDQTCLKIRAAVGDRLPSITEEIACALPDKGGNARLAQQANAEILELSVCSTSVGTMGELNYRGGSNLLSFDDS